MAGSVKQQGVRLNRVSGNGAVIGDENSLFLASQTVPFG